MSIQNGYVNNSIITNPGSLNNIETQILANSSTIAPTTIPNTVYFGGINGTATYTNAFGGGNRNPYDVPFMGPYRGVGAPYPPGPCNPCNGDPRYQGLLCDKPCGKDFGKKRKSRRERRDAPQFDRGDAPRFDGPPPYGGGGCGPCSLPYGPGQNCFGKDPCPLKSFCDPGLANTCNAGPLIDPYGPRRAVTTWKINYLISNRPNQAAHDDPALVNPWGIVVYNNQLWVSNNGTDSITNYDLFGNKLLGTVTIRGADHNSSYPTGIAINCGGGFIATAGTISKSGMLLIVTEHGTVHSYNPCVDTLHAFLVLDQQLTGEVGVYRGVALANNTMYIADFFQGHIDVFDAAYGRILGFNFVDGDTSDPIPLDYGPDNIVQIGCYLYVLWARRDPLVPLEHIEGPGNGYISVFNLDGSFVRRFTSRGVLNTPWAMIPAPCECGFPPGSFLVSNRGDGRINIFDCNGGYVGPLLNQAGLPIVIEGLWGLAPHYTDFSEIFFSSSANENIDGLVGSIVRDQIIYF